MDWYKTIFELIDMRSFSNLWYWIMLGVIWSSASHWVLGVPYDMISRAHRHGGQPEADLEALVRIKASRMLYVARTAGLMLVGIGFFLLSMLALLGFWYDVEFAQALLFLVGPLAVLFAMSVRQAGMIEAIFASPAADPREALYVRLRRHRLGTQLLGMVAIFVTSLFGMWQNMQIGFPH